MAAKIPPKVFQYMEKYNVNTHNYVTNCKTVKYEDTKYDKKDVEYMIDPVVLCTRLIKYGAEYNPKKFSALKINMINPRGTLLFYKDGKLVCTGCFTHTCAIFLINKFIQLLNTVLDFEVGMPRGIGNPKAAFVKNVVASGSILSKVDLNKLNKEHKMYCEYEPDLFPGLAMKIPGHQGTMLVFQSGNFIVTGPSTEVGVYDCLEACIPLIEKFLIK